MKHTEFWIARPTHYWHQQGKLDGSFSFARQYEDAGLDGLLFFDTQNLAPECYVSLAAAAKETSTLKLGTGVTNPMTRHAAVTASAMATLQMVSKGRAYLGIGRGDSSLAHLGYSPASTGLFEKYLCDIRSYLSGETVEFAQDTDLNKLELAERPDSSQIQWLQDLPRVPFGVAATGPKVIAAAARNADRIDLTVGANPERMKWAIDIADEARQEAGIQGAIPISAYVIVIVHDDPEYVWRLATPVIASQARFTAMHGKVVGPTSDRSREVFLQLSSSYNMKQHGQQGSPFITSEFAHEFGIFGSPAYCIDRIEELAELGVDRFILVGSPDITMSELEIAEMAKRFVTEVIPAFK